MLLSALLMDFFWILENYSAFAGGKMKVPENTFLSEQAMVSYSAMPKIKARDFRGKKG